MRKRKFYDATFKEEIARGYHSRQLSAADIEAKGVRMNNVHRWVHELFGKGGRQKVSAPQPAEAPPATQAPTQAPPETEPPNTLTLIRKKIKRGANGRYPDHVKAQVAAALREKPVPEVAELTGLHPATLYLWKEAAEKKNANGSSVVIAPEKKSVRHAEVIVNPASTEDLLANIRKGEGFANLDKAVKQLKAAHKSGAIDDYDEIDLRFLLGFRLLTGAALRSRR